MNDLLIIRHAQSRHNILKAGNLDSELTELGLQQAKELAEFLKRKFDDMSDWKGYVSPFMRTIQTAQAVCEHTGVDFDVDCRLHEWGHISSGYTFKSNVKVPNRSDKFPAFFKNTTDPYWNIPIENEKKLLSRMTEYADFLNKQNDDKVILISHGMPIYTLIYILKGNPMVPKWDRKILNTSVTWFNNGDLRYFARFINSGNDPRSDSLVVPHI